MAQKQFIDAYVPCGARVLVARYKTKSQTEGGLILPDQARTQNPSGIVVAVGEAEGCPCAVGDRVIFNQHHGQNFRRGDVELVMLRYQEVVALLKHTHVVNSGLDRLLRQAGYDSEDIFAGAPDEELEDPSELP